MYNALIVSVEDNQLCCELQMLCVVHRCCIFPLRPAADSKLDMLRLLSACFKKYKLRDFMQDACKSFAAVHDN